MSNRGARILMVAAVVVALAGCSSGSSTAKQHPDSTTSSSRSTTTTTAPPGPEGWTITPKAPVGVLGRYAVWTGTEYIGGPAGCCDGLGGSEVVAYSPTADRWRPLASFPLRPRHLEVAAWTGQEMIVVGGREARDATDTTQTDAVPTTSGAALDPAADTWRSIAPMPAPMEHPLAAVWTGHEMVVLDHTRTFVYSPTNDRWRTGAAPPFARDGVVILAAGRRVIVWGGRDTADAPPGVDLVVHADGAVYDPAANRWTTIPNAPVPARTEAAGVWTGRRMIVWGGLGAGGSQATGDRGLLGKGAAYTPSTNTWRALPASPLKARWGHQMLWTGREALVWGGSVATTPTDPLAQYPRDGAAYDPRTDTWRRMTAAPPSPPALLTAYTAVWTGREALFIGGETVNAQGVGPLGLAYTPGR